MGKLQYLILTAVLLGAGSWNLTVEAAEAEKPVASVQEKAAAEKAGPAKEVQKKEFAAMEERGEKLYAEGKYAEAEEVFVELLEKRKKVLGEKHPDTLESMNNLAVVYQSQGHYLKAMGLIEQALLLTKEVLGEKHEDTLRCMANLAVNYQYLGRYQEALVLNEQIMAVRKDALGEKNPAAFTCMNNLAADYSDIGCYQKAMEMDKQILDLEKETLGERHPNTLISMTNLAADYTALGHYKEAVALDEQTLILKKEVLGEKHPDTLQSMVNLAAGYTALGRYKDAMEMNEKALIFMKEVLGEKHPNVLTGMINLASDYTALGCYTDAMELDEKTLALVKEVLGEKHPNTLTCMANLAMDYTNLGRYQDAVNLNKRTLALRKEVLGEKHLDTLTSMTNLASDYTNLGRYQEAMVLNEQSLVSKREVLGKKHPDTLTSMNNLAADYKYLGRYQDTMELDRQTLALEKEVLGKKHPDTLTSMANLAVDYSLLGRYQDAIALNEQTMALRKEILGEKHPNTLKSMANLAAEYSAAGRYQKALELGEQTLALRKEVLGEKHPDTLGSINNLATDYQKAGTPEKSLPLYREMIQGYEMQRSDYGSLTKETRQVWFSTVVPYYKNALRCFIRQGQAEEAFHTAELCKARSLMEQYAERLADNSEILDDEELQQLNGYRRQLAAYNTQIAEAMLKGNTTAQQNLTAERDKLGSEYQEYRRKLQENYPKYKELSEPEIVDWQQGQEILPENTVFLDFLQHGDFIEAFVLSREKGLQAFDLTMPKDLASGCSVYHNLISYKGPGEMNSRDDKHLWRMADGTYAVTQGGEQPANHAGEVTDFQEYQRIRRTLAENLGEALLDPLTAYLPSGANWLISPDGDLDAIPFETLFHQGKPAIETADISYIQSLSVLRLLQKRQKQNAGLNGRKELFAMGDAIYGDYSDEEAKQSRQVIAQAADAARSVKVEAASVMDLNSLHWENLPGSAREIQQAAEIFPEGQRDLYVREAATEPQLRNLNRTGALKDYKYLLFATHGIFFPQAAELSSIVLGRSNAARTNGYVTVSKWMGYDLHSDLVYLSACESGLGKDEAGEGIIGLPYALCIAGNQDTVMSLWKINDAASARFSAGFFQKIKAGMGPLKALNAMKREFMKSSRNDLSDPSVWSTFLLYGI